MTEQWRRAAFFYYTGHLAVDATGRLHKVTQADGHALAVGGRAGRGGRGRGGRGRGRTFYIKIEECSC